MSVAIFPGSFDPITNGHVDIINQAAAIFDKVYVVVMVNTAKKYLFTNEEREDLINDAVKDLKNVQVLLKPDQLTVNVARDLRANTIVRGVRNTTDFLFEQQIAEMNKKMASDISTVLLFTEPENSFVASSIIKEIAQFNGDFASFLPTKAAQALKEKIGYNKHE
ncbi:MULTISPECIES: pantetheine-phosphate adenylyltransferase [Lactobacillus]|uniref:pantetheine-phosphate adenylyltransferase n=1 Tax=Lactobacillus TaxID=1578 RepID=UPI0018DDDD0F|nr:MULTISPECIES: pantetheine-phosphate adenylyltransferase [unclassified Lactobacillus]MBI0120384.1 pantetheine-phosphate adenylyltransferase [Lactobacillus sp. M0398]MBI0122532.1 pantetheine-phosphate adenylyltransferase [Lactobacillus sp. W8174]MBI0134404.1 pantetheine-phosphate adenylyltransferase [Lactobacillus sp. W8173]